jgi:hypothetical protein
MQAARLRQGAALSQAPCAHGLLGLIAISMALGEGTSGAVLALDAHHSHRTTTAPSLPQVRGIAVAVAASWTGDPLAELRKRLSAGLGRPAAYRKDAGSERHQAISVWEEPGLASPSLDELSHAVAGMRKRREQPPPTCATLVSACGRVSGQLTPTLRACLAPPPVHPKARFLPVHRLVTWADRLRNLSPAGGAKGGSTLSQWRACLAAFPACKALLTRLRDEAIPLLACQQLRKTHGLSSHTLAPCEPLRDAIPSQAVRREFAGYLQYPLQTATALGLDHVGLPLSAAPIASLCGVAQPHGVGESQEVHRMALRLPALGGTPPWQEAKQVLAVSVAEQQELTARFTSLTTQRRQGLPNPDALESLGEARAQTHVELIPRAKNRSNDQHTVNRSMGYKTSWGPGWHRQDGHRCPERAVSSGKRERVSAS